MTELIFSNEYFAPGIVHWNEVELDRSVPLETQVDFFLESLIWVEYLNGVHLIVGWHPACDPKGQFRIRLTTQDEDGGLPLWDRWCRTVEELEEAVEEAKPIAVGRPSIPQRVFTRRAEFGGFETNELRVDRMVPLRDQAGRFEGELAKGSFGFKDVAVTWEPPRDPAGRFVVRVWEYDTDLWFETMVKPSAASVREYPCATVEEMSRVVWDVTQSEGDQWREPGKH